MKLVREAFGKYGLLFRMGYRNMLERPAAAVATILLLTLGFGLNLALFTSLEIFYLRAPDGVRRPESIRRIDLENVRYRAKSGFTRDEVRRIREECSKCLFVASYRTVPVIARIEGRNRRITAQFVDDGYFEGLGVRAHRGIVPSTSVAASPSTPPWIVLSFSWWSSQFGRDPDVVGRSITIGSGIVEIVGIAEPRFRGLSRSEVVDAWVSDRSFALVTNHPAAPLASNEDRSLSVFARLANQDAVTLLRDIAERLANQRKYPGVGSEADQRVVIRDAAPGISELRVQGAWEIFAIAATLAAVILVVTCLNLTQLATAKALTKRNQIAIQLALGARPHHTIIPLLVEQSMVVIIALVSGLFAATMAILSVIRHVGFVDAMSLSPLTVAFGLAMGLLAVIAMSLTPLLVTLWTVSSNRLGNAVKTSSPMIGRMRQLFIGLQVMFAALLLFSAATVAVSLKRATSGPLGFVPSSQVLVSGVDLSLSQDVDVPMGTHWEHAVSVLSAEPGVRLVAMTDRMPSDRRRPISFTVQPRGGATSTQQADRTVLAGDFFELLQFRLLAGNVFGAQSTGKRVAVVSSSFARQFGGPPAAAIGMLVREGRAGGPWSEVIGVVNDTRAAPGDKNPSAVIYFPVSQVQSVSVVARLLVAPVHGVALQQSGTTIDNVLQRIGSSAVTFDKQSLAEYTTLSYAGLKMALFITSGLAGLAFLIAGAGCYGNAAFSAATRTREAGIRAALGASRFRLFSAFAVDGFAPVVLGAAVGTYASVLLLGVVRSQVEGVESLSVGSVIGVGLSAIVIAMSSGLRPNWKLASVDPAAALRVE